MIENNFNGRVRKKRLIRLSLKSDHQYLRKMENLFFLLAATIVLRFSSLSKKYTIGRKASFTLFFEPGKIDRSQTKDGDMMHTGEWTKNGITYGIILIEMQRSLEFPEAEETLKTFMDSLQAPFDIVSNSGIQPAVDLKLEGRMVQDYWQDSKGQDWKVKGLTNGSEIALLYIRGINDISVVVEDAFLDSFSFNAA